MVFDATPTTQPIPVPSTSSAPSQSQEQPGLLDRLYQTSGAKGLVDLASKAVQRPIDLYHQAVEAAQAGDWKTASERASTLVTGGVTRTCIRLPDTPTSRTNLEGRLLLKSLCFPLKLWQENCRMVPMVPVFHNLPLQPERSLKL